jgi:hypothetical protein
MGHPANPAHSDPAAANSMSVDPINACVLFTGDVATRAYPMEWHV